MNDATVSDAPYVPETALIDGRRDILIVPLVIFEASIAISYSITSDIRPYVSTVNIGNVPTPPYVPGAVPVVGSRLALSDPVVIADASMETGII